MLLVGSRSLYYSATMTTCVVMTTHVSINVTPHSRSIEAVRRPLAVTAAKQPMQSYQRTLSSSVADAISSETLAFTGASGKQLKFMIFLFRGVFSFLC